MVFIRGESKYLKTLQIKLRKILPGWSYELVVYNLTVVDKVGKSVPHSGSFGQKGRPVYPSGPRRIYHVLPPPPDVNRRQIATFVTPELRF